MQQGNAIFGAIIVAYIIFIIRRGELPTYLTLLRGGGQEAPGTGSASTSLGLPTPPVLGSTNTGGVSVGQAISVPNTSAVLPQNNWTPPAANAAFDAIPDVQLPSLD